MKWFRGVSLLSVIAVVVALAPVVIAQSSSSAGPSFANDIPPSPRTTSPPLELVYTRPTERTKIHNFLFDALGPYAIATAAAMGGIDQATKTPPEWGQGVGPLGERVGSDFGIELATTTTRYGLAEAFREDTLYYRCECRGIFPRLNHSVISTVTARRGDDGHRRLSFPALIAPYAGSMTSIYGWYPRRYGLKDGLRMGNYTLLEFVGGNIAREFISGGPHSLFSHLDRSASTATDSVAQSNP